MKGKSQDQKLRIRLARLCLFVAFACRTQAADWPEINTNIVASIDTGFAQGWAFDGTNGYLFATDAIYLYSSQWRKSSVANLHPFAGLNHYNHLGAGTYYKGQLYASMEDWHGCGHETNQSIGVFDAHSLRRISVTLVTNYQDGVSAVTVASDLATNGLLIAASFCDGVHLFEYALPNLHYVKTLTLSQNISEIQGIGYYHGFIIVDGDAGTNGLVYAIKPATGEVHHLATLTVPGANEYEGLDVSQGDLRIAEAATQKLYFYNFKK